MQSGFRALQCTRRIRFLPGTCIGRTTAQKQRLWREPCQSRPCVLFTVALARHSFVKWAEVHPLAIGVNHKAQTDWLECRPTALACYDRADEYVYQTDECDCDRGPVCHHIWGCACARSAV